MKTKSKKPKVGLPASKPGVDAAAASPLSRRKFMRAVGLASGAAVAAPIFPGAIGNAVARTVLGTGSPIKIGIILDRMNIRSGSLMKGLQLYTKQLSERRGGYPIEIITEETGAGLYLGRQIAEKLIYADQVSFALAAANSRSIEGMEATFDRSQVSLIEASAGEVIPKNVNPSPYLFRSTLNLWQAHAAMGHWVASNIGKRAAVACSFFNAGFDFHRAFIAGFEEAGGEIAKVFVTGAPDGQHPFGIMEPIKALGVDLVYGSYSSYDALVFAQAYQASGIGKPLFGTDYFAGNGQRREMDEIYYATTWSAFLANDENSRFISDYRSFTGSDPDGFAYLGYDTARIALTAAESAGGNCHGPAFLNAMSNVQFRGPRGEIRFDSETNSITSPLYMASYINDKPLIELPVRQVTHDLLYNQNASGITSGWLNPYHSV